MKHEDFMFEDFLRTWAHVPGYIRIHNVITDNVGFNSHGLTGSHPFVYHHISKLVFSMYQCTLLYLFIVFCTTFSLYV